RVYSRAIWRQCANRIGIRSVPGEQGGLTTATAKIDFFLRTTLTWLRHPFRSTEPVETFRFTPNPIERACPNIFKMQIGNRRRSGGAGEHVTDGIDSEISLSPAVETRFGPAFVIVWEHIKDVDLSGKPRFCRGRDFSCANNLFAGREQCRAVEESPAVKLRVGELDSLGS